MLIALQATSFDLGIHRVRTSMKRPKQYRYPEGGKVSVIAPNYVSRQFNPEQVSKFNCPLQAVWVNY